MIELFELLKLDYMFLHHIHHQMYMFQDEKQKRVRKDAISITVDFSLRVAQRSTLSPNRTCPFSYPSGAVGAGKVRKGAGSIRIECRALRHP